MSPDKQNTFLNRILPVGGAAILALAAAGIVVYLLISWNMSKEIPKPSEISSEEIQRRVAIIASLSRGAAASSTPTTKQVQVLETLSKRAGKSTVSDTKKLEQLTSLR